MRALLHDDLFILFGEADPLVLKDKVGATDDDPLPAQTRSDAVRDGIFHIGVLLRVTQLVLLRTTDDRLRDGMREMLLKAGGEPQHIFAAEAVERDDFGDARLGHGQSPRLIKDDGVGVGERLDIFPALYQHAAPDTLAHRGEDGERRRKLDGAGIVHHQRRGGAHRVSGNKIDEPRKHEVEGNYGVGEVFGASLH